MNKITDLIGNTPLVDISSLSPNPNVKIFGKLEGHNPGGSVKDRAAYGMIKGAIDRGELNQKISLIEATSGNTGIALAMIASTLDVKIELVMPENSTKERIQTMRAFGATVTLTPSEKSMEGAIDYANDKVKQGGFLMLNQFGNPDNYMSHYHSTGPEIWRDTNQEVTHFVSAMGTTGTIMGVSRFLKEQNSDIQIIGAQPTDGSRIPGIRRWPKEYLPKIFEPSRVDKIIDVSQEDATAMTKKLARKAVFGGMSSGGSTHVATEIAKQIESGTIVCIICDRGDRYLSSDLFL
ncbi:MAG: cysteine synthase CysM [Cytophagales bacterium]|nr:cysteine synthase CysM [Cytophagales bacterium]